MFRWEAKETEKHLNINQSRREKVIDGFLKQLLIGEQRNRKQIGAIRVQQFIFSCGAVGTSSLQMLQQRVITDETQKEKRKIQKHYKSLLQITFGLLKRGRLLLMKVGRAKSRVLILCSRHKQF